MDRLDARIVALAVLVMAIFGGSYTMVKVGLQDLPVFGSLLLRALVSMAVMGVYMFWARLPFVYRGRAGWFLLAQASAFVAQQASLYLGLALTSAGRGAILFNVQPFITLFLLPLFAPSERASARGVLGTLVAFAGVTLVLGEKGLAGGSLMGDLLILVGAVMWSLNVVLNRTMPRELHPVGVIFWSVAATVPATAMLTWLFERDATWTLTPAAIVSVLYLGALAAGFAFAVFVWLTHTYSPRIVNPFVFLAPVFGVIIGWGALGEQINVVQAVGAAAVAGGIWLVSTGYRLPEKSAALPRS